MGSEKAMSSNDLSTDELNQVENDLSADRGYSVKVNNSANSTRGYTPYEVDAGLEQEPRVFKVPVEVDELKAFN